MNIMHWIINKTKNSKKQNYLYVAVLWEPHHIVWFFELNKNHTISCGSHITAAYNVFLCCGFEPQHFKEAHLLRFRFVYYNSLSVYILVMNLWELFGDFTCAY